MRKSLVSVIIPNYNYSRYLGEAIDGVLAQTYEHIEIVVVDDGSTDESGKILDGYGDKITTIKQQNQGVSAARNNGLAASSGEFVALLDADDSWLPAKIERELERFSADPELGLVHVGVREIDGDGNPIRERLDGAEGDISNELLMMAGSGVLGGGSGFMAPRRVLDEIGGFDIELSTSADWDLFYRIASRYRVGFVPEILVNYRVHGSNMHSNVGVMERDMTRAFEKAFNGERTPWARRCYGSLFANLSGSYFYAGDYSASLRTGWQSLKYRPASIFYFLGYPVRRLQSRGRQKKFST